MKKYEPYEPCPCGSGKKFKFCCYKNRSDGSGLAMGIGNRAYIEKYVTRELEDEFLQGQGYLELGLKLMDAGDLAGAAEILKRGMKAAPNITSFPNNLAFCLARMGDMDKAILMQAKANSRAKMPNIYGYANLASFYLFKNKEAQADKLLDQALVMEIASSDACAKLCEILAVRRRHGDIVELAERSGFMFSPFVRYYAGVAAANLGEKTKAIKYLGQLKRDYPYYDMARHQLDLLSKDHKPISIRGDWPYYAASAMLAIVTGARNTVKQPRYLPRSGGLVYACEQLINVSLVDGRQNADLIELLVVAQHPSAIELLWLIVKGTVGPDSYRFKALNTLADKGELAAGDEIEVMVEGKPTMIQLGGILLDEGYRFCEDIPLKAEKAYGKRISEITENAPYDWEKMGGVAEDMLARWPDYFPARHNLAVSLQNRGQVDEAEAILRDIVATRPDYLFSRGALLLHLQKKGCLDEAEELVRTVEIPKKTHPNSLCNWHICQALYLKLKGEIANAKRHISHALTIYPSYKVVNYLADEIEDLLEEID